MMVLTIISILVGSIIIGALLARRFTVFVLVPTVALDLVLVTTVGVAQGDDVWSVVLAMFVSTIGLQLGYFAGTATVHLVASARTSDASAHTPDSVRI
jgi:hypothetical protein